MNILPVPETAQQAIVALQKGDKAQARELLVTLLQENPEDERFWLWLSWALETEEDQQRCLERLRFLNPDHPVLKRKIADMNASPLGQFTFSESVVVHSTTPAGRVTEGSVIQEAATPPAQVQKQEQQQEQQQEQRSSRPRPSDPAIQSILSLYEKDGTRTEEMKPSEAKPEKQADSFASASGKSEQAPAPSPAQSDSKPTSASSNGHDAQQPEAQAPSPPESPLASPPPGPSSVTGGDTPAPAESQAKPPADTAVSSPAASQPAASEGDASSSNGSSSSSKPEPPPESASGHVSPGAEMVPSPIQPGKPSQPESPAPPAPPAQEGAGLEQAASSQASTTQEQTVAHPADGKNKNDTNGIDLPPLNYILSTDEATLRLALSSDIDGGGNGDGDRSVTSRSALDMLLAPPPGAYSPQPYVEPPLAPVQGQQAQPLPVTSAVPEQATPHEVYAEDMGEDEMDDAESQVFSITLSLPDFADLQKISLTQVLVVVGFFIIVMILFLSVWFLITYPAF